VCYFSDVLLNFSSLYMNEWMNGQYFLCNSGSKKVFYFAISSTLGKYECLKMNNCWPFSRTLRIMHEKLSRGKPTLSNHYEWLFSCKKSTSHVIVDVNLNRNWSEWKKCDFVAPANLIEKPLILLLSENSENKLEIKVSIKKIH